MLRPGDALVVWKVDRIGRSLAHVVELVGALQARGVGLKVLTGGIDTTNATGRLVLGIFATLSEFERPHPRAHHGRPRGGAGPRPHRRPTAPDDARQAARGDGNDGRPGQRRDPDLFQPYGGFPDGVRVENGHVVMPELPGIGFEGKSDLIKVMRELSA